MQYRKDRYGKALSILGFGCMRSREENDFVFAMLQGMIWPK